MSKVHLYLATLLITFSCSIQAALEFAYLEYPPYAFEKEGKAQGITIEILKNLDSEVTFIKLPPARLFLYLESEEISCGLSSSIALSTKAYANNYYLPLLNVDTYIFYLKSHGTLPLDYFRGKDIAVLRGVQIEKSILKSKYGINSYDVNSPTHALKMIMLGRLEGLHMSASAILNLKEYDSELVTFVAKPAIKVTAGFYINKKNKQAFDKLKRQRSAFFNTQSYRDILKKHLNKDLLVDSSALK
mgnify:FL=1